jgi:hypothetical protein
LKKTKQHKLWPRCEIENQTNFNNKANEKKIEIKKIYDNIKIIYDKLQFKN